MYKLWEMSTEELTQYKMMCIARGNLEAMNEACDFIEFFHKNVKVIKGRKVPKGTQGEVVWIKRRGYANTFSSYVTTLGIKDKEGKMWYTNSDNVELI